MNIKNKKRNQNLHDDHITNSDALSLKIINKKFYLYVSGIDLENHHKSDVPIFFIINKIILI